MNKVTVFRSKVKTYEVASRSTRIRERLAWPSPTTAIVISTQRGSARVLRCPRDGAADYGNIGQGNVGDDNNAGDVKNVGDGK